MGAVRYKDLPYYLQDEVNRKKVEGYDTDDILYIIEEVESDNDINDNMMIDNEFIMQIVEERDFNKLSEKVESVCNIDIRDWICLEHINMDKPFDDLRDQLLGGLFEWEDKLNLLDSCKDEIENFFKIN